MNCLIVKFASNFVDFFLIDVADSRKIQLSKWKVYISEYLNQIFPTPPTAELSFLRDKSLIEERVKLSHRPNSASGTAKDESEYFT